MRSETTPSEWSKRFLYDLGTYQNGRAFRPADVGDKGLPVIKIAELNRGIADATKRYAGDFDTKHEINEGDLLFAWSGSPGIYRYPGPRGVLNQHIFKVTAAPGIDQAFLRWLLEGQMPIFRRVVADQATTMGHVKVADLKRLTTAIPDLDEQRRIGWVLGSLDDKIELNRRIAETLEQIAATIFKARFVDFVGIEKFEDSELGPIPKGWRVGALGDVLRQHVERAKPSEKTREAPYLPIDAIGAKQLLLTESRPGDEAKSSLTRFEEGDILFGAMRPYFHKVTVAPFSGTTRTTVLVLKPATHRLFSFALMRLHQEDTIDYATRHSRGSTIPYARWHDSLAEMPIVLPPDEEIEVFDSTCRPLIDQIAQVFFQQRILATVRDTLLPKLVSGEIRVPESFDPRSAPGDLVDEPESSASGDGGDRAPTPAATEV